MDDQEPTTAPAPSSSQPYAELIARALADPKAELELETRAALAAASDPELRRAARPWILRFAFYGSPFLARLLALPPAAAIGAPVADAGKALTALVGLRNSQRAAKREGVAP